MSVFEHPDFDGHEQVLFCTDAATGLRGIIAIHSTALGPAAGGCRMHPYPDEYEALTDVLRLSRGMSYKNSAAGLPLGGGKSVVIADPRAARQTCAVAIVLSPRPGPCRSILDGHRHWRRTRGCRRAR